MSNNMSKRTKASLSESGKDTERERERDGKKSSGNKRISANLVNNCEGGV